MKMISVYEIVILDIGTLSKMVSKTPFKTKSIKGRINKIHSKDFIKIQKNGKEEYKDKSSNIGVIRYRYLID